MARSNGSGAPRGRKIALTPKIVETVEAAIRSRNYNELAAALAGVDRRTYYSWLRRGRRVLEAIEAHTIAWGDLDPDDRKCADFVRRIERVDAEAEGTTLAMIGRAGTQPTVTRRTRTRYVGSDRDGNPIMVTEEEITEHPPDVRHLEWIAERRWSKRWGAKLKAEVSGPDGGPIPIEHRIDTLLGRHAELRARGAHEADVIDVEAKEA